MCYCSIYRYKYKKINLIKIIKIEKDSNIRLDKYLKLKYSSLTQSYIEKNIRKKNIIINNSKTLAKYLIKKYDEIKILNFNEEIYKNKIIFKKKKNISKNLLQSFNKAIIFENEDFIILNKWSSIATQGGSKINISIDDIISKISVNYRLVHRLDKDTSGLLIVAKNVSAAKKISYLFKSMLVKKTYIAVCEGVPRLKESIVNLDIKSKSEKIEKTQTYFKLLYNNKNLSLILFKPQTGKTHQLRIVSKNLGCPIVGDSKYNIKSKYKKENLKLNAHALNFKLNNKDYEFISKLPIDFKNFLKKLEYEKINKIIKI